MAKRTIENTPVSVVKLELDEEECTKLLHYATFGMSPEALRELGWRIAENTAKLVEFIREKLDLWSEESFQTHDER